MEKILTGWQKQPTKLNIQGEIERAIENITGEKVDLTAYNCKQKTYRYIINNAKQASAIYRNLEYYVPIKLNIEEMKKAIKHFEGEHDFKGFKASGTSSKSSIREIYKTSIKKEDERIIIELTGNGFLYNMVRIIVGTLVDVGLGKIKSEQIPEIINSKDRTKAGKTLPPYALYLVKVEY